MGVVVVVVVVGGDGSGQREVIAVEKILLTAVIGEENFILLGEVLVNAEASLGRDHVIQNCRIKEIVYNSRSTIACGNTRQVGGRQITLDGLSHRTRDRNLVVEKWQATGLPSHDLGG